MTEVYVYLLNEGSDAWRPVPAIKVDDYIYDLLGVDIYDPEDEEWEFPPGTRVRVEVGHYKNETFWVAVEKITI